MLSHAHKYVFAVVTSHISPPIPLFPRSLSSIPIIIIILLKYECDYQLKMIYYCDAYQHSGREQKAQTEAGNESTTKTTEKTLNEQR